MLKSLFGDKKFYKNFFLIAIPVMAQQLITNVVSLLDNLMVGGYSNAAVSGVFAANQTTFVFNIACFGIVAGAGIFIQQNFGAKNKIKVEQAFHFKIYAILLLFLIGIPLIIFLGPDLINFYASKDSSSILINEEGWKYLRIALWGFIPFGITVAFMTTLREIGKTKVPLYSSLVSLATNFTLNYLLINGNFGFPRLGVEGAAIATITSRAVEMLIIVLYSCFTKQVFLQDFFKNIKIPLPYTKEMLRCSFPLFINEILWSAGMTFFSLTYSRRPNVLSALSIVSTISDMFVVVFNGLAAGIGVMVGHKLGTNELDVAKENSKKLLTLGVLISVGLGIIMASLSPVLPLLFKEVTMEQKHLATKLILIYASSMWLFSFNCCIYMCLKCGGKSITTMVMDSGFVWLVSAPLAFILAAYTNIDIVYIYLIVNFSDIIKAGLALYLYLEGKWINNLATPELSLEEIPLDSDGGRF